MNAPNWTCAWLCIGLFHYNMNYFFAYKQVFHQGLILMSINVKEMQRQNVIYQMLCEWNGPPQKVFIKEMNVVNR